MRPFDTIISYFWDLVLAYLKGRPRTPLEPESLYMLGQALSKLPFSREKYLLLTQTSRFFRKSNLDQMKLEDLMHRVVWGNLMKAEALLKEAEAKDGDDPNKPNLAYLLCNKVTSEVPDPSSKPYKNLTPFEAALCAGDVAIKKNKPQMSEMFESYFKKIPHGLEEMHRQIKKIFPDDFPEDKKTDPLHVVRQKQKANIFKDTILIPLLNTIIAADGNQVSEMFKKKKTKSPLGLAFETFRAEVKKINFNDRIFNPYYLLEAFNVEIEHFETRYVWCNWDKYDLACIQGIGFIQRYLPACVLQAFVQGINEIIDERKHFIRTFEFTSKIDAGDRLRIGAQADLSGLGFDYWLVRGGMWRDSARRLRGSRMSPELVVFTRACYKIFIQQKHQACRAFCEASTTTQRDAIAAHNVCTTP